MKWGLLEVHCSDSSVYLAAVTSLDELVAPLGAVQSVTAVPYFDTNIQAWSMVVLAPGSVRHARELPGWQHPGVSGKIPVPTEALWASAFYSWDDVLLLYGEKPGADRPESR